MWATYCSTHFLTGLDNLWKLACIVNNLSASLKEYLFLCEYVSTFIYMCARYSWRTEECVKSLGSELHMAERCHMGAGNCAQVLWESERSQLLSHLSQALRSFLMMESPSFVPTQVNALVSSLCLKLLLYLCMYECVCAVYVCVRLYVCVHVRSCEHVCKHVYRWKVLMWRLWVNTECLMQPLHLVLWASLSQWT